MSTSRLYFAYGSNMSRPQMAERCPAARAVGRGLLQDYTFRINARGVATLHPQVGGLVRGVLWYLTPTCEAQLDRCEGVARRIYVKAELPVLAEERGQVEALVYLATCAEVGSPRPGYLERIVAGAADFGLPDTYLSELRSWAS